MKINWGTGIAIFYSSFVLIFLFIWYQSTKVDHSLVSDTYYEDDYQYQGKYDGMKNNIKNPMIIDDKNPDNIVFKFPKNETNVVGTVNFLRSSDKSKDFKVTIEVNDQNEFVLSKSSMIAGPWDVSTSWTSNGKSYFNKTKIIR